MKYAKFNLLLGISVAIIFGSGATTVAFSSGAADDNLSPSEIFKKARENYASLTSYSDEGKIIATMDGTTTITSFAIRLARTNFYYIEWHRNSKSDSTMDAGFQAVWSSSAGNFLERGLGPENEGSRDTALAKANALCSGAAATIPTTFFNTQWGNELNSSMFSEKRQTDENDEKIGNIDCYVFTRESQGQTETLWIGKQDFLIHQFQTVTSAEAMVSMAERWDPEIMSDLRGFTLTETHTNIVENKQFLRSDFVPSNGE
jgi:outer membrane lipoprotein-sorting protein